MDRDEIWIRLACIPGVGPATVQEAVDAAGGTSNLARALLDRNVNKLKDPRSLLAAFYAPAVIDRARRCRESYLRSGCRLVTRGSPEYPRRLAATKKPPVLLGIVGTYSEREHAVAMVGSRRAVALYRDTTQEWAQALAASQVSVVSGLAYGIDRAAHEGALEAGGHTVAVLGTGPDIVYPRGHERLARDIVEAGGALVSQFRPGIEPGPHTFPARNATIAGLADVVVVMQAGEGSGALITARYADEHLRPVLCAPGPLKEKPFLGSNGLLDGSARAAASVNRIAKALGMDVAMPVPDTIQLPEDGAAVLKRLGFGGMHADDLARALGLAPEELAGRLLMLQLRGLIRPLPGNRYARTR